MEVGLYTLGKCQPVTKNQRSSENQRPKPKIATKAGPKSPEAI